MKLFQFHIKWTLDLSSGKTVVIDTKILETWNIGKLSEKIITGLDHPNKDEFERSDIKAEVMENNEVSQRCVSSIINDFRSLLRLIRTIQESYQGVQWSHLVENLLRTAKYWKWESR